MKSYSLKLVLLGLFLLQQTPALWAQQAPVAPPPPQSPMKAPPPPPPPPPGKPDTIIRIGEKEIIIRDSKDAGTQNKAKVIIDDNGIIIRSNDDENVLIIDNNGVHAKNENHEFIIDEEGMRTIDRKKNEERIIIRNEQSKDGKKTKTEEKKVIIHRKTGEDASDGSELPTDMDIDVEIGDKGEKEKKVIIHRKKGEDEADGSELPMDMDIDVEIGDKGEKEKKVIVHRRNTGGDFDLDIDDAGLQKAQKIIEKVIQIGKPRRLPDIKTRWLMLDLGMDGYMQDGSFDLNGDAALLESSYKGNIQVSLHLFRQRVNLIKHHLNLLYGLSFDFHNYNFEQDITLAKNTTPLEILLPTDNTEFKRNRLKNTYLTMPLLLNIETNPYKKIKSFRLNAGMYGGIKIGSRTVQITEDGEKTTRKDGYNLSNFRYGLMGMVGVGPINFTLTYSLQPLFAKGKGPEVYPVGLQIALIPF